MITDMHSAQSLDHDEETFERGETAVRIGIALLFFLIARVVEALFAVLAIFCLLFALVTRRRPSALVRGFAMRTLAYAVEIGRYLSYVDDAPPFPFRELPEEPRLYRKERDA